MDFAAHWTVLTDVVLPMILTTAVLSVVLFLLFKRFTPADLRAAAPFIFVFCLLGAVCGYCVGSSRESVVGAVLPSLLTLISAVMAFAFTKDSLKVMRAVIPYCLVGMLLTSIYWTNIGSKIRFAFDYQVKPVASWGMEDWEEFLQFQENLEIDKANKIKAGTSASSPTPTATGVPSPTPALPMKATKPPANEKPSATPPIPPAPST